MKSRKARLLLLVPIVLLALVLVIPAAVSATPGKANSDNAAVHLTLYYPDTGLTYNVIYHGGDPYDMTVTGAEYPKCGPLKVK